MPQIRKIIEGSVTGIYQTSVGNKIKNVSAESEDEAADIRAAFELPQADVIAPDDTISGRIGSHRLYGRVGVWLGGNQPITIEVSRISALDAVTSKR
jgi:hypothetical protein